MADHRVESTTAARPIDTSIANESPVPPTDSLPQPGKFYDSPLSFTGTNPHYGGGKGFVNGIVDKGERGEVIGRQEPPGSYDYSFSVEVSSGPRSIYLIQARMVDGGDGAVGDAYSFGVYILTPST